MPTKDPPVLLPLNAKACDLSPLHFPSDTLSLTVSDRPCVGKGLCNCFMFFFKEYVCIWSLWHYSRKAVKPRNLEDLLRVF